MQTCKKVERKLDEEIEKRIIDAGEKVKKHLRTYYKQRYPETDYTLHVIAQKNRKIKVGRKEWDVIG